MVSPRIWACDLCWTIEYLWCHAFWLHKKNHHLFEQHQLLQLIARFRIVRSIHHSYTVPMESMNWIAMHSRPILFYIQPFQRNSRLKFWNEIKLNYLINNCWTFYDFVLPYCVEHVFQWLFRRHKNQLRNYCPYFGLFQLEFLKLLNFHSINRINNSEKFYLSMMEIFSD